MKPWAALALFFLSAGAAVSAPPTADVARLLWCGSAFYWLASDAYDAGDNDEGKQYEAWSDTLMQRAAAALKSAGRSDAEIQRLSDQSDEAVVGELGKPAARYDVTACPELVEPN